MKIIFYCQHVLGIGHLFRAREICRALVGHDVILITGGPQIEIKFPKHVRVVRLPELQMDRKFKNLDSADKSAPLDQIKKKRQKKLLAIVEKERPDIFFLELFPFGRQAFRFELDPALQAIRSNRLARCGVISSVRDILVEKEKPKHERRALERLNTFFDAVLVHSDPNLIALKETFFRFDEIRIPVIHTGYIAQKPLDNARNRIRKQLGIGEGDVMIVASAGGGSVGKPILESAIQAFGHLKVDGTPYLYVYTGPYMAEHEVTHLKGLKKSKRIQIEKFKSDFLSYLAAADISISMAGYNTTMNILAADVPALVWPFAENREQRLRAERLADRGLLRRIDDQDLDPADLAGIMGQTLARTDSIKTDIDLDGAVHTVQWLEGWISRNLKNS
ncbi:MAG: glycosyltransferase [Desulfobacterales bacterium]|jgi:predicted glycosyltransferase